MQDSGLRVMNSPSGLSMGSKSKLSKAEIDQFQNLLTNESIKAIAQLMADNRTDSSTTTISLTDLKKCLEAKFGNKAPCHELCLALYNRFRPLKIKAGGEGIEQIDDMDIVDFLLGCNLLSRSTQDRKIKLMFELCDDDDDGCMNPVHIL